jgi:hypothetical protein
LYVEKEKQRLSFSFSEYPKIKSERSIRPKYRIVSGAAPLVHLARAGHKPASRSPEVEPGCGKRIGGLFEQS